MWAYSVTGNRLQFRLQEEEKKGEAFEEEKKKLLRSATEAQINLEVIQIVLCWRHSQKSKILAEILKIWIRPKVTR